MEMADARETTAEAPPPNCPICAEPLRRVHRLGFHIDQCKDHGIWIETDLIDDFLRHARRPSMRRSRRARKADRRRGVVHGALFGWAALLFDDD